MIVAFGGIAWTRNTVIPSNLEVAQKTLDTIEENYRSNGNLDSLTRAEVENVWGQPIKIIVAKLGAPSNALEVTVISRGPLGMIGNVSVSKLVETR